MRDRVSTESFGDLLRRYRLAAGLTQEELAERARLSLHAISDLERGARKRPWRDTIRLLADALQLAPLERARLEAAARPKVPLVSIEPAPGIASAAFEATRPNLPASPTPLIGRERELTALEERLLRRDVRLLTLTGPGGVGKTRLALEIAGNVQAAFPDGVFVVSLAPVRDPELVLSTIARVLGIGEIPERPLLDIVKERLRERRMLLLLDNFEHLLPAAPLVAELLACAPSLKVLATSRAILHLRGEGAFVVPPLAVPVGPGPKLANADLVTALSQYDAVRLFVERAQDVEADFALTMENVRAVGEICSRLEGLPLAIELAVRRLRVLSPPALLALLACRLPMLTSGARDLPARQRTLRDTIAWSYDLLADAEKLALRRLAVFVDGFSVSAVGSLLTAALPSTSTLPSETMDVLDLIEALVGQSLIRRTDAGDGEPRYEMLETIREFGLEQLAANGEQEAIQRWHAGYFTALVEAAEPKLATGELNVWLDRLESDYANLRSALAWCAAQDAELGLRLAAALQKFWDILGYNAEGRRWLEELLPVAAPGTPQRARALLAYIELEWVMDAGLSPIEEALAIYRSIGDKRGEVRALTQFALFYAERESFDGARPILDQATALAREDGDPGTLAFSLLLLGRITMQRGDYDQAWRLHEESLNFRRRLGSPREVIPSLVELANIARLRGDYGRARGLFDEALALTRSSRGHVGRYAALLVGSLGYLAWLQGDLPGARAHLKEGLTIAAQAGARFESACAIMVLGEVAISEGRAYQGARLIGACESLSPQTEGGLDPDEKAHRDNSLAAARAILGDAAFAQAWAEGQAMTLEHAVAYALEKEDEE